MNTPFAGRLLRSVVLVTSLSAIAPAASAQPATAALVDAVEPRVIEWRRHLHENAELSYQEVKTGVKALVEVSLEYMTQAGAKR